MSTELAEVLRRGIDAALTDVWTALPARVDAYDPVAQTVDVTPMVRRALATEDDAEEGVAFEDIPPLPGIPVVFPRGGGCSITFPLSPGDHVLLVVSIWDPSGWRVDGVVSDPGFVLAHYLGGAFAIPGIAPMSSPIDPAAAGAPALVLDAPEIRLTKEATTEDDFIALAKLVDDNFAAVKATLDTLTGGGASFGTPFATPGSVASTKVKAT